MWIWVGSSVLRIGVRDLHHSGGAVGKAAGRPIGTAQTGIAAVDVGAAVFSAKHRPFGEYGKSVEGSGPGVADGGVCQNSVIECDIDAVMIPVKSHGLDGSLLRLENFRCHFLQFRHRPHRYHLQS